ncbi:MAG TPA: SdrD B-like domain-containing protein [Syntrophobacteraceae bacterium]|nr:SdrD B-like domain-containing protein [Syntrophobacteraceae bacterium]
MAHRFGVIIFFLVIQLAFTAPRESAALDEGGVQTGVIYDSQRFRTSGEQFYLSEIVGFADFHQTFTNYGVLEGRVAFSDLEQHDGAGSLLKDQQTYERLTFRDFYWGRSVLQASLGDQSFQISNLPVSFSNAFCPTLYFRGLSLGLSNSYLQMQILGGEATISRGLLAETFETTGEDVYGVALRSKPSPRLTLEGDFFHTENEKDYQGNLVTRSNDVYRIAGDLRTWSNLYTVAEFMQSFSEDPYGRNEEDIAYRAGAIWRGDRLHLEGNYHYSGPDFHLFGPIYQSEQNVGGFFASGDVNPWPFLGFSGSFDSAQNNLMIDPSKSINESDYRSFGLRFFRPPWPTFYWRYYSGDMATRGDFPVTVNGLTQGHYAEICKPFSSLDAYLRYEYFRYDDKVTLGDTYTKYSPLVGVRTSYKDISAYAEAEYDQFSPPSQGQGSDGLCIKTGGSYAVSKNLFLSGEISYRPNGDHVGGQLGIDWKLPRGFSLCAYGQAQTGKPMVGDFVNDYTSNMLSVRLTKTFSWGEPTTAAGAKSGQGLMGTGSIEGWVFDDRNLNGALDQDEKGVEGVKVKLEDGSTVVTDSTGRYYFPSVSAGRHFVILDAARIPAAYTFIGSETTTVEIRHRASARVDFPFILGADIRGRVLAAPKEGEKGDSATGVPDVLVELKPGDLNTYTDSHGNFSFKAVIPKQYEISLAPDTLPERAEVLPPQTLTVKLSPGEKTEGLQFTIHIRERRVVFEGT